MKQIWSGSVIVRLSFCTFSESFVHQSRNDQVADQGKRIKVLGGASVRKVQQVGLWRCKCLCVFPVCRLSPSQQNKKSVVSYFFWSSENLSPLLHRHLRFDVDGKKGGNMSRTDRSRSFGQSAAYFFCIWILGYSDMLSWVTCVCECVRACVCVWAHVRACVRVFTSHSVTKD